VFAPGVREALAMDPAVLLVAIDQAAERLPGHHDVVVVGSADEEARAWGTVQNVVSSRVVILPQGGSWLAEYLGGRLAPAARGVVVGFVGAAGGCGVSTFAFWCASALAGQGVDTLLVDGQAGGGGLDLALGTEDVPGVRWHDLSEVRGTLNPQHLRAALPAVGKLSFLSHATRGVSTGPARGREQAGVVFDAARSAFPLTVVDAGGGPAAQSMISDCDQLVLLVPSRQRRYSAAVGFLATQASLPVTLVVRGPVADGLDAWHVAEATGRPAPLAYLPFVRSAPSVEAGGRLLEAGIPRKARKAVATVARTFERLP
jgi:secretion/DNA translocation related CpaE-like protein